MSLTPEHIEALESLGYKREEGMFLYLVAIHSGYFTHRHFLTFAKTRPGYFSHEFIRKLLQQKHAGYDTFRSGARVYHLFSRQIYQAIGKDDLRTRRRHSLEYIRTRLVTLDFILRNPQRNYLETETEKVPFFENVLGLDRKVLPVKSYRSSLSREATPRYFVDRFPIFVTDATSSLPVATFTFVDSGSVTLLRFKTHLLAYGELLRVLPRFEFLFVAPTSRLFHEAESEFFVSIFNRYGHVSIPDLLKYFRVRQAWDEQKPVASADVFFLSEARRRFSRKIFESLYEQWRFGKLQDGELAHKLQPSVNKPPALFQGVISGESLRIFYPVKRRSPETCISEDSENDSRHFDEVSK